MIGVLLGIGLTVLGVSVLLSWAAIAALVIEARRTEPPRRGRVVVPGPRQEAG